MDYNMVSQDIMRNAISKNYMYPIIFYNETFRQISRYLPEFDDKYFVSNYGRIYNCHSGFIQSTQISNAGYEQVALIRKDKTIKVVLMHRIVAICFLQIPENYKDLQVNHINGNKLCNWAWNLEWVTASENMIHCYRNNLEIHGENHPWATITEEIVVRICELLEQGYSNPDIAEIVFGDRRKDGHVNSIRIGNSWVEISQKYNIPPSDKTHHFRKRFTNDELSQMYKLLSLGMKRRAVAETMGIDMKSLSEDDRERIYRVMRNLMNGTAYKYIPRY